MLEYERVLGTSLVFVLTLLRCGGLAIYTPFLGAEVFPPQIRVAMAAGFAILILPAADASMPEELLRAPLDMTDLALLAAQEVSVGLVVGFLSSFVFLGAQLAGELAGQQIGFSMANVVDPMTDQEVPILGFFQMNLATVLFVTAKLHLVIVGIMAASYRFVGIGELVPQAFASVVVDAGAAQAEGLYVAALQLGMPVMLVMLMNSVVEGFVTRTIPQLNIMVLGLPLRIVIGLSGLLFLLPAMCWALIPPEWIFDADLPPEGIFGDMLWALMDYFRGLEQAALPPP